MTNDYGNWFLVIFSIAIFMLFLKSAFHPRTKSDWRTFKMFGAFIVALFAEMYGFPLTIYLLTSFFGNKFFGVDFTHDSGHILNKILRISGDPHFSYLHIISNLLIVGGLILISSAWDVLYKSQKKNILAVTGLYHYVRHPQYVGFVLIIIGFLLQWPTLITLIMAPILIIMYIRLARKEEKEMILHFGVEYGKYKKSTPAFFPSPKTVLSSFMNNLLKEKVALKH